jgi:hypothetical protein
VKHHANTIQNNPDRSRAPFHTSELYEIYIFRLLEQLFRLLASGFWKRVVLYKNIDVLEEHAHHLQVWRRHFTHLNYISKFPPEPIFYAWKVLYFLHIPYLICNDKSVYPLKGSFSDPYFLLVRVGPLCTTPPFCLTITFPATCLLCKFLNLHSSFLKMEAVYFSETSLSAYKTTQCMNPEDHNL